MKTKLSKSNPNKLNRKWRYRLLSYLHDLVSRWLFDIGLHFHFSVSSLSYFYLILKSKIIHHSGTVLMDWHGLIFTIWKKGNSFNYITKCLITYISEWNIWNHENIKVHLSKTEPSLSQFLSMWTGVGNLDIKKKTAGRERGGRLFVTKIS